MTSALEALTMVWLYAVPIICVAIVAVWAAIEFGPDVVAWAKDELDRQAGKPTQALRRWVSVVDWARQPDYTAYHLDAPYGLSPLAAPATQAAQWKVVQQRIEREIAAALAVPSSIFGGMSYTNVPASTGKGTLREMLEMVDKMPKVPDTQLVTASGKIYQIKGLNKYKLCQLYGGAPMTMPGPASGIMNPSIITAWPSKWLGTPYTTLATYADGGYTPPPCYDLDWLAAVAHADDVAATYAYASPAEALLPPEPVPAHLCIGASVLLYASQALDARNHVYAEVTASKIPRHDNPTRR